MLYFFVYILHASIKLIQYNKYKDKIKELYYADNMTSTKINLDNTD